MANERIDYTETRDIPLESILTLYKSNKAFTFSPKSCILPTQVE